MQINRKWKLIVMSAVVTGSLAAAPMAAGAESIDKPLQNGVKNADVGPLQKQLKTFDYYSDQVDGIYGVNTMQAVRALQNDYDINQDGIFGTNTADALGKTKSLQETFKDGQLLRQGDEGKKVKTLQTQLERLKYYNGDLDGIFGPKTETSTENFQQNNDIAVDGIAGPNTYEALTHNPMSAEAAKDSKKEDSDREKAKSSDKAKKPDQAQGKKSAGNDDGSGHNGGEKKASQNKSTEQKAGKSITVSSTAYTANCSGCSGVTSTGVNLKKHPDKKVIAVDPDVIPLGSTVMVPGYGKAVAADTGGAINGKKIDVFVSDHGKATSWGEKTVTVKVLD